MENEWHSFELEIGNYTEQFINREMVVRFMNPDQIKDYWHYANLTTKSRKIPIEDCLIPTNTEMTMGNLNDLLNKGSL